MLNLSLSMVKIRFCQATAKSSNRRQNRLTTIGSPPETLAMDLLLGFSKVGASQNVAQFNVAGDFVAPAFRGVDRIGGEPRGPRC